MRKRKEDIDLLKGPIDIAEGMYKSQMAEAERLLMPRTSNRRPVTEYLHSIGLKVKDFQNGNTTGTTEL